MQITGHTLRKKICVGLLSVAASAATLTAATTNDTVDVPFKFYRHSIIVEVMVAGKGPLNMLLDTGVNPSVIDRETARAIGLKLSAQGGQGSGGGTHANRAYETSLPVVELGGLKVVEVDALASDLSKMSTALGKPLQGVLGYSLLKNRVVQFDYPKQRVRFYAKSPYPVSTAEPHPPGRTTLPFTFRDDILVEGILVNGQRTTATFDTGSNGTFQLTPAAVTRLGLEKEVREAQASHSTGFNGVAGSRGGSLDHIKIGDISVDAPKVTFFNRGAGYDDAAWELRIGNAFLKDFVVTVDYRNKSITLERPDLARQRTASRRRRA